MEKNVTGNIIELKGITKRYEDNFTAVEDFNLEVRKGEFVTFLGPSGCGKTTTLRMIAGFDIPTEGKILLNGEDISKLPPNKRPINTVFQRYALFPHLNIFDNIAFGLKLQNKYTRKEIAEKIAKELNLDSVYSELLPEDKVRHVEELLKTSGVLAFVGDGVNDAPVLARADIGIAMGAMGSDAAIEAADIVLMDDNPKNIGKAIKIGRKTMGIAKQNIIFALAVKVLVLILAAVGIASMWAAVFADVGVCVVAILNAMRAGKLK